MPNQSAFTRAVLFFAILTVGASATWAQERQSSSAQETELLAVLRSDASPAEKAITCKRLSIHGSSKAVPELSKLLSDKRLSSWARIALEAIPGGEADAALRKAAETLEGDLLVGAINSIGVRRDAAAVESLTARLKDKDLAAGSAAAVALGRIGNASATKALRESLAGAPPKVRSAIAEGCVLCAERLHADGKAAEAVAIYDQIRGAEVPKQRIIEATRGAILARKEEGLPLLLEILTSTDKRMFQLALGTAREFPGSAVDQALAKTLESVAPNRGALIVTAMADRPNTVDRAALVKAAADGPKQVRLAAVDALGRVGDGASVTVLLETAQEKDPALSEAAKQALAGLANEKVDSRIVAMLSEAKGKSYALLIELVGERRIQAVPELMKALEQSDPAVRSAALTALGETIALPRLPTLISQVVAPKYAVDAPAARRALRAASVRMPDREACAAELAAAMNRAKSAEKDALLEILAEVGGAKALETLATAAKSSDGQLQDTSSRLLGKWNSVDAAPVLLDLAKNAPERKYQVRALRGYIGLARKFAMPEPERVAMCRKAFESATRPEERKLVLDVLKLRPSGDGLKLAVSALKDPELKQAATATALVIAEKIGGKNADIRSLLSKAGLEKVKLEIIKAEYGAGSTQKDVTAIVRKHAGDYPLITLPSSTYNVNFGGDPLPGTNKKLRIEYRFNGKQGEASFAENALIVLPPPK